MSKQICVLRAALLVAAFLAVGVFSVDTSAQAGGPISGPACTANEMHTCNSKPNMLTCAAANKVCIGTGVPDAARLGSCTQSAPECPPAPPCPSRRPPGVDCPPAPPCVTPPPKCPVPTPSTYAPRVCECAPTCTSSASCASGRACAAGHCRQIACNADRDCRSLGTPCVNGYCQLMACTNNSTCARFGKTCGAGGVCR
jgi:hypothetical protein